jgi:hypothetical protein
MPTLDEPRPRTPWRLRIFRALVAVTLLLLATVVALVMLLPQLALIGITRALDSAAIHNRDVGVRTVTLQATYLGPLRFGDKAGELHVEEVQMDHRLTGWKPQPGPIRVLGLRATVRQTDSGWAVDGLADLMAWLAKQPPSEGPPPTLPKLQLTAATIDIVAGDFHEQVTLDATATAIATNAYRVTAKIAIRGNPIELAADVDVGSGTVSAKWRSTIALGSLENLLPVPTTGLLQLSGDLQTANWQPTSARVALTDSHLRAGPDALLVAASKLRGMLELVRNESGNLQLHQALLEGQIDHAVSGPWRASGNALAIAVDGAAISLNGTQLAITGPDVSAKIDLRAKSAIPESEQPWPVDLEMALYETQAYGWELPLTRLSATGNSDAFEISAADLRVTRYEVSGLRDFKADVTRDPLTLAFRADARLVPLELLPAPVIGNEELYRVAVNGRAEQVEQTWRLAAELQADPQRLRVRVGNTSASARLALAGALEWSPETSSGKASVALLNPSLAAKDMIISADSIGLVTSVTDLQAPRADIQSSIVGGELKLANDFSVSGMVVELPGSIQTTPELSARGDLQLRVGAISHGKARCESVNLRLPFAWTGKGFAESASGALRVTRPAWDKLALEELNAEIALQAAGVTATANLRTPQPDLSFDISHATTWGKGLTSKAVIEMPQGDLGPLGTLLGEAEMLPVDLSGIGSASAVIEFDDGVLQARAESKLAAVSVSMPEAELSITGITGSFAMADLLTMRGEPHQRLQFSGIEAAGLRLGEGEVALHVESDRAVFIEDFWVKWCGGTLRTHAIRWDKDNPDLNLELRAEKLQLGQLAALTKSYGADGSGRLYGKLPLRYHKNKIELQPGFLYSIPGQGGQLKIAKAGMLTAGVPNTHPSFKNLKLAEAALRDFRYDYFRLEILDEEASSPLTLRMLGRAAVDQGAPPFELEFNINTEGTTLDRLLNAGLSLERMLNPRR